MKLLILGGNGMAGHLLVNYFRQKSNYYVFYTSRDVTDKQSLIVDATNSILVDKIVEIIRPDVIINAVGILNHDAEKNKIDAYHLNSFLPHRLSHLADQSGSRLIHISTDCVFKGDRGHYRVEDSPDGTTMYAITKALGEVCSPGHLTIRTSIIGPEIRPTGIGLIQWFLKQTGEVSGYTDVWWNGVTTLQLAKFIERQLVSSTWGMMHLAHPTPINKHDLLKLVQKVWKKRDVNIIPDHNIVQNRTLVPTVIDGDSLVPDYEVMLKELYVWMNAH